MCHYCMSLKHVVLFFLSLTVTRAPRNLLEAPLPRRTRGVVVEAVATYVATSQPSHSSRTPPNTLAQLEEACRRLEEVSTKTTKQRYTETRE